MTNRIFGKVNKICAYCRVIFPIHRCRIETAKYCSISCSKKGKSFFKGKHHTIKTRIKISMMQQGIVNEKDWIGFKRNENYLQRKRFKYSIQGKVFSRDNYTCQICNSHAVDLQVDHIKSWSKYPKLRFNMNNCRTLCAKCHYQITFNKHMPDNIRGWGHHTLKGGF